MSYCSNCDILFTTVQDFHAHCRDEADHPYCVECQCLFATLNELDQHLENVPVHDSSDGEQHYESESYIARNRALVHRQAVFVQLANQQAHFLQLLNHQALLAYLANLSLMYNWCFICSRHFSSLPALIRHNSSRVHHARIYHCPFCLKSFNVPSAIAHHIESGCHLITRHQVTSAFHCAAKSSYITPTISLPNRIQNGPSEHLSTTYTATSLSFNGKGFECYLCHRIFHKLSSLNDHLRSPAHDNDEFQCPKCQTRFTVVSALIQHIESETCGLAEYKQVDSYAAAFTEQFAKLLMF